MSSSPATERYDRLAVVLHWLLALLIVSLFALGVYMADLPVSPARVKLFNWHKWAGMVVLALTVLRQLWRLYRVPPALLPGPTWERRAAHLTHAALYLLSFAVPLLGWAYSSAEGFPIVWFGVLPVPDWVPRDHALAAILKSWHAGLAWAMVLLAAAHAAAALKHRFVDHDAVMARMRL